MVQMEMTSKPSTKSKKKEKKVGGRVPLSLANLTCPKFGLKMKSSFYPKTKEFLYRAKLG